MKKSNDNFLSFQNRIIKYVIKFEVYFYVFFCIQVIKSIFIAIMNYSYSKNILFIWGHILA